MFFHRKFFVTCTITALSIIIFSFLVLYVDSKMTLKAKSRLNYFETLQPSGKCGYEYFYKRSEGEYLRLNKITNSGYVLATTTIIDGLANNEIKEDNIFIVIYTDACKEGISDPTYYYNGGKVENVLPSDIQDWRVEKIVKASNFTTVLSYIFSNPIAEIMNCRLEANLSSADEVLKNRIIVYSPRANIALPLTSAQEKRIREMGREKQIQYVKIVDGNLQFMEGTYSIFVPSDGIDSEGPEYDCGEGMSQYTFFMESLDTPNVFVKSFFKESPNFLNNIRIIK